jgi:hypothetical protein
MQLKNADLILIQFAAEMCRRARRPAVGACDALAEAEADVSAKETMKHSENDQIEDQRLIQQQIQYRQASDHVGPEDAGCHPSEAARNQDTKCSKPWPDPRKRNHTECGKRIGRANKINHLQDHPGIKNPKTQPTHIHTWSLKHNRNLEQTTNHYPTQIP